MRLFLRNCRQQRGEVVYRADLVPPDDFEDLLGLRAVEMLIGTFGRQPQRHHAQIGGNDALGSVALSQGWNQLGADLTESPGDQDTSFHLADHQSPPRRTCAFLPDRQSG